MKQVAIIIGSKSDLEFIKSAEEVLNDFKVEYSLEIISAHRCLEQLQARIKEINEDSNYKTVIAAAGGAAHLPGVVAAMTVKPVIGVPVPTSFNSGLDSLLSICQMPGGIPVATFAVGKSGPKNAALYALQIIGLQDEIIATKLQEFRKLMNEQVQADNAAIQNK